MPLNTAAVLGALLHKQPVFTMIAEPVFPL
jgi:hypothetical protein